MFDFFDYTLRNVILGSALLGIVGGVLGSFALLRRQSLMGDALAHAALPGIAITFMLTGTKTPELLLLGAGISGWLGTLALLAIVRGSRIKEDAALGTVLTVFFGLGILLLTRIQRGSNANQSGLDSYLFGQAATLVERDVIVMAVLAAAALALLFLFYKEFKLVTFDRGYAASLGYPTGLLDVLLTTLIVLAVLIGLQTVGVVLMVAMLIAPAAAARQWTDRLGLMLALSALFGATSGFAGAVLSSTGSQTPTGPLIVLVATGFLVVSLFFAPNRGIVGEWLRHRRQHRQTEVSHLLAEIEGLLRERGREAVREGATGLPLPGGEGRGEGRPRGAARGPVPRRPGGEGEAPAEPPVLALASGPFSAAEVAARGRHSLGEVTGVLPRLVRRRLLRRLTGGRYALTDEGAREAARAARNQRLWQAYLAHQLELPVGEVHLDVGDLERSLPPELIAQLESAAAGGGQR